MSTRLVAVAFPLFIACTADGPDDSMPVDTGSSSATSTMTSGPSSVNPEPASPPASTTAAPATTAAPPSTQVQPAMPNLPVPDGAGGTAGAPTTSTTPSATDEQPGPSSTGAPTAPGQGGSGGEVATGGAGGAQPGAGGTSGEAGAGGLNAGGAGGAEPPSRPARVLLYSFGTLDIPSLPAQLDILSARLESWGYTVDESEDPGDITEENLARYAAVGMINTCFSPFGENNDGAQEGAALQAFLNEGGGLFGTHCADVTFQDANPPALYNQLLGGRASRQNFEGTNQCRKVEEHETTAGLPETFSYVGNLDGTDFIADDSLVLVHCTWGDANQTDVAVSWVRNEGPGRVFFTNFAKVDADLTNETIGDAHILAGLAWVLGRSADGGAELQRRLR